jgi:hypothetical protein
VKGSKVKSWEPVHCFLFSDLLLVAYPRKKGVAYNFGASLRIKVFVVRVLCVSRVCVCVYVRRYARMCVCDSLSVSIS